MPERNYDVAILGGGPGGYVAAIRAAQLGLKVCVIERDRLGGICLNWGCIPTKALLKNAEVYNTVRNSAEWGISCSDVKVDFTKVIKRSRDVASMNSRGVEYLFKKNKIELIAGRGKLFARGKVEVTKEAKPPETIASRHIILATGARARSLPGVAIDGKKVITSTEAMVLGSPPASMIIIGAGAIGVEFAYLYNSFGTKVTIVEMMPTILPVEDREIARLLESNFRKHGIEIHTGARVERVTAGRDVAVSVTSSEGPRELHSEIALMSVGVQGNVEDIGLEALGVKTERGGWITVDDLGRTSVEGIWAIGDVAGAPWLAHVASREGVNTAEAIAGKDPVPIDYDNIPGCTYCQPQVASIGLTEEKAAATGRELAIGRYPFTASGKARAIGETDGLVKLIFDRKYGGLLGAHILGADATEMIAELAVARTLETTARGIISTIHAHPTLSEAVMEAAENAFGHAIHI